MLNWLRKIVAKTSGPMSVPADPELRQSAPQVAALVAANFLKQGNLHLDQGRLDQAEKSYREALSHDADLLAALVNLGFVLKEMGRHTEAAAPLRQALLREPNQIDALLLLGLLAQQQGDLQCAAEYFQRCHRARPDFEPVITPLCDILQRNGAQALWQSLQPRSVCPRDSRATLRSHIHVNSGLLPQLVACSTHPNDEVICCPD